MSEPSDREETGDREDGVPDGTLVRPPGRRRTAKERWEMSRRWFLANTAIAGFVAAAPAACRPAGDVPLAPGDHQGHPDAARPATPVHRPPPESGTAWRQLTPFRDPLPVPPRADLQPDGPGRMRLVLPIRPGSVRLHADLPPTTIWGYDGRPVGPTIEVRRGTHLTVEWSNELSGPYPLAATEVQDNEGEIAEFDLPGLRGAPLLPQVAALPPWVVTHLHGALTGGGNDGWPENAVLPGRTQIARYENDQPACALWYHDHAMHISRFNTMAGLSAGLYLVRDDEEDAAGLPAGDREVPLVVCDRNLDTDSDGRLTGRLLHKIVVYPDQAEKVPRSFTGPFTLVNGMIWPFMEVEPTRYRFRLLNASSIRQYDLSLRIGDADVDPDAEEYTDRAPQVPAGTVTLVGTDAGLLPEPVPLDGTISISPAERLDLVVDFSAFAGQTLRFTDECFVHAPIPQVMQFRVAPVPAVPSEPPRQRLAPSFTPVGPSSVAPLTERLVLVTPAFPVPARMWEMEETDAPRGRLPMDGIVQFEDADGRVRTFRRVASEFNDPVTFFAAAESFERWRFLSLEGPGLPHPMHVHAFTFQVQSRVHYDVSGWQYLRPAGGGIGGGTRVPVRPAEPGTIGPGERGWKDVVRVGSGELVDVIGRYGPASGRFLHHCHIYEHEDHKMMRPFSVLPAAVMRADPHVTH